MMEASRQFETVFHSHHKALCNLAFSLVRDKDAAKDVVQDVFMKLWKNIDHIVIADQIQNYLFKATVHTALNHLRRNTRLFHIGDESFGETATGFSDITTSADLLALEEIVDRAIQTLPPRCKIIYLLSRHEGLRNQQIAETLGLSVKTVENQMTIALEKLRKQILPFVKHEISLIVVLMGAILAVYPL